MAYLSCIDPVTDVDERGRLCASLLAYCERGNEAMVRFAQHLSRR
jgi:hypothetical protein